MSSKPELTKENPEYETLLEAITEGKVETIQEIQSRYKMPNSAVKHANFLFSENVKARKSNEALKKRETILRGLQKNQSVVKKLASLFGIGGKRKTLRRKSKRSKNQTRKY